MYYSTRSDQMVTVYTMHNLIYFSEIKNITMFWVAN